MTSPSIPDLETRVTELEITLGDAEDTLEVLNLTVFRQQRQIEQLHIELIALRRQIQESPSGEPRSLRDEIPPHY